MDPATQDRRRFDSSEWDATYAYIRERQRAGEVATGLLYLSQTRLTCTNNATQVEIPLAQLPYDQLCPGSAELENLQKRFR
jgi:2-oxoglutarate ferredoxin oxidoreductase subunit beta